MLGAGRHEDCVSLPQLDTLVFYLEHSSALEHHVDLVVLVWLLPVWFRCDEHVHPDLEAGGAVNHFVATGPGCESFLRACDVERLRNAEGAYRGPLVGCAHG